VPHDGRLAMADVADCGQSDWQIDPEDPLPAERVDQPASPDELQGWPSLADQALDMVL
jgi:hypothetical protein